MICKLSEFCSTHHHQHQDIRLSRKMYFWGLIFCLALFVTNPASCSESREENENDSDEFDENFLVLGKTSTEFPNIIEGLESTNNTKWLGAVDENEETVLHKADQQFSILKKMWDILKARMGDFNAVDDDENLAFFEAVQDGKNVSFLTTLISSGMEWNVRNRNNDTPLHAAALNGNLPVVNFLLSLGSDVNAQNSEGQTPLHQALLSTNVSSNAFEIVGELLTHGANTNISDNEGKTALHLAAINSNLQPKFMQIIKILIEHHSDANAVDNLGNTFLHYVAQFSIPAVFHDTVAYLDFLNNTNSLTMKNEYHQKSVLHEAVGKMQVFNKTLKIFQSNGFDFKSVDMYDQSIMCMAIAGARSLSFLKILMSFGADLRHKDLSIAAFAGNLVAVKLFIQLGADVNAPINGFTPLHFALMDIKTPRLDIVSELVRNGANGNIQDESGNFPIGLAWRREDRGGSLEYGVIQILESMKSRPSFNQTQVLEGAPHFSNKLQNILKEIESVKSNTSQISKILFKVIHTQDLDTIKGVLDHVGNSSNVTEIWDEELHSLLHVAIKYRDYSIVEYLINSQGFAEKLNDPHFNANLVELCLKNLNMALPPTFDHKTRILQLLFSNFNKGKQFEWMKMLIKNNATTAALSGNKMELHLAANLICLEPFFLQIMRRSIADADAVDERGNTFLHIVAEKCTPIVLHKTVAYLDSINNTNSFTIKNYRGKTILSIAVENMKVQNETLDIFHKRGVDFNAVNLYGESIWFRAISSGRSALLLKNLITFGADWEQKNWREDTPLHHAARYGNSDRVKLLMQFGADVNAINSDGNTPLHEVFLDEWRVTKLDLVSELIKNGANVNIRSKLGKLPIDLAQENLNNKGKLFFEDGIIQLLESTQNPIQQGYE